MMEFWWISWHGSKEEECFRDATDNWLVGARFIFAKKVQHASDGDFSDFVYGNIF